MYRMKVLILSLLAVAVLGSVASATASAEELQGPWWKHFNANKEQVKYVQNKEQQFKSKNEGSFILKGTVLEMAVTIECKKVIDKGWLWNGLHQGQDEAKVSFTECSVLKPVKCENQVTVSELNPVYTELMWKYRGEAKELKEVGQQKIYDAFGTAANGEGKFIFVTIKIEKPCLIATEGAVEAAGTTQEFIDQNGGKHQIKWGTAALVEPQNEDVNANFLKWIVPNVKSLHHQEKEVKAELLFAGKPAELEGKIKIELEEVEPFGAFNE